MKKQEKKVKNIFIKLDQRGLVSKGGFFILLGFSFFLMVTGSGIYWHFARDLPQIISVADYRPLGVTRILGVTGKGNETAEIGEFFKERRYLIPYEKMPEHLIRAFISAEDDRFFEHPGINILSIIRAGIANFKAGHVVQGGSTITQQVAKSLLLTPERSFDRKIKEVILASKIERNLTKQQILYLYLNQIYLGHGAYGVQAACRTYFRKDVAEISLAEAALLAGMPQAPGKYSPLLNPKKAKERQLYVLKRMLENKYISPAQFNEASNQPLKIFRDEDLNSKYAPYLVEHIRKYLIEKYGEKAVYEDGLTVFAPIQPELAKAATEKLREGLRAVDKRIGYRGPVQHLNNSKEIEDFLADAKKKLIEKKIHFQLLLPDGKLDLIQAMNVAGIQFDADLINENEIYQGVIIGFDNKRKIAKLMIGSIPAELSIEKMKWAKLITNDSNSQISKAEPVLPSRTFHIGDVILVRKVIESNSTTSQSPTSYPEKKILQVALEQEPLVQGALLSLDVQTGNVLAMVGGYDFSQSEFNRAIQAMRQPGSAFKPIIYASALEKGFTPASIIVDSPIVFKDADGKSSWKPNNFESKFYGDTTFRQALIKSRNIPTVKIVQSVQVPYVIQYAKRLGTTGQFSPDLSIALGSGSTSLLDMTKIFSLFPRLGRKVNPIFVAKVLDRDGNVIEEALQKKLLSLSSPTASPSGEPTPHPEATPPSVPVTGNNFTQNLNKIQFPDYPLPDDPDQVLDPRVAYVMTHLMKEVVAFGTGHEAKNLGRAAAGKTGTTNDFIDAWFMGFTPHIVTGVWVGYDSQKSIGSGETGAKAALPIWLSYMKEAVKNYPDTDFSVPPGVVFVDIDFNTGKLAPSNSSTAIKEAFIAGTQPTEYGNESGESSEAQSDFFKEDTD